jgi:hypothetical protein
MTGAKAAKYVLRDLPGVAELEALIDKIDSHPNPAWAPEQDELPALVDRVSRALFGITRDDTRFDHEGALADGLSFSEAEAALDRWEQNFGFLYEDDDAPVRLIYEAMGWDVWNEEGGWMQALDCLDRQIVCVMKVLRGHLPGDLDDEAAKVGAQDWGAKLAADAAKFRGRK